MSEPIFESNVVTDKEFNNSIMSFKDCPNHCVDGYYVDPYKHKRVRCQYCADLRKKLAQNKITVDSESIEKVLRLPFSLSNISSFDINVVIPKFSRKKMVEESIVKVSNVLQNLINNISVGDVSDYSMLFNLGALCHEENFVYAYLIRAYMSGLDVSPYYSSHEIVQLRNKSESTQSDEDKDKYDKLLKSDVCITLVETGASYDALSAVMGVVQLRSFNNKSTIVFTKVPPSSGRFNSYICSEEDKCKNILTYYTVEFTEKYIETEKKREEAFGGVRNPSHTQYMSKNSFDNLTKPFNNL